MANTAKSGSSVKVERVTIVAILSALRQREKTLRVAEALREQGLDEEAVAKAHVELVALLLRGEKPNGSEKLLFDELKEITRLLEPTGAGGGSGSDLDSFDFEVIHDIPRPQRPASGGLASAELLGEKQERLLA